MKIYEKIKSIRKKLGLTLQDVYNLQIQDFGPKGAISLRTLKRIEDGQISKFAYILKICQTLGISLTDLLRNTDMEQHFLIKKNARLNSFAYNETATGDTVSSPASSFSVMELRVTPGGKTAKEQCPNDEKTHEKHIYIIKGALTCFVGENTHFLKQGDTLYFNGALLHWYENQTKKTCVCLIYQTPKIL